MIYLKYLKYVLVHKWHVFLACRKLGITWLGIIHDMDKFYPDEFGPYARYFKGKIDKGRSGKGYYKPYDTGDAEFDFAWFLHQKRNKHHWQWWVMPKDMEDVKLLEIPDKYIKEMVADWIGANKAQKSTGTPVDWYMENRHKLQLHPETAKKVEDLLWDIYDLPRNGYGNPANMTAAKVTSDGALKK